MTLKPEDIANYPLKQVLRGYCPQQVDELLDQVAVELERLLAELEDARRRLERAESRADPVAGVGVTVKRTLLAAQEAADRTLADARRRAAAFVEEAEQRAAQAAAAGDHDLIRRRQALQAEIESLAAFERDYRTRLRKLLRTQLEALEALEAGESQPAELNRVVTLEHLDQLSLRR